MQGDRSGSGHVTAVLLGTGTIALHHVSAAGEHRETQGGEGTAGGSMAWRHRGGSARPMPDGAFYSCRTRRPRGHQRGSAAGCDRCLSPLAPFYRLEESWLKTRCPWAAAAGLRGREMAVPGVTPQSPVRDAAPRPTPFTNPRPAPRAPIGPRARGCGQSERPPPRAGERHTRALRCDWLEWSQISISRGKLGPSARAAAGVGGRHGALGS